MKEQILKDLHEGVVTVSFLKLNGDRRDMQCTLNADFLPLVEDDGKEKKKRPENPDVQSVWDVNAKGWRSFRWDRVIYS